jgi:TPR repeat protein
MVMLALVYAEGLGVPKDEAASLRLLDAAQTRWPEAIATYVRFHGGLHGGTEALPPPLAERLAKLAAGGDAVANRLRLERQLREHPDRRLTDADLAPLIALDKAGKGRLAGHIGWALWRDGRREESVPWLAKGAAQGQAAVQDLYARALADGLGVPKDEAAAERWWREAAAGGDTDAMQTLAQRALNDDDYAAAVEWYQGAASYGSEEGAWYLANVLEVEHPKVQADLARSVRIYRDLADSFDYAPARRSLARLHLAGEGVEKDPAKARALLLVDAERDEPESQILLGSGLARGEFGEPDAKEGERWMRKALAKGGATAADALAYWLYFRRGDDAARKEALALWKGVSEGDDDSGWNNYAWVLCTTRHDVDRDGAAGLALVGKLGDPMELPLHLMDTVAACQAAVGDFRKAAVLQKKVVDDVARLDAEDPSLPGMRDRLALYAAGKPYVEAEPDADTP